jgi:anti-anti-sigma factor
MREVTFLDSTGLRILLAAHQAEGFDLAVVPGPRAVAKAFEVTGLDRVLRFVDPA